MDRNAIQSVGRNVADKNIFL